MSANLLDLLSPVADKASRINGVVVGIVTSNRDPDGMARVRVKFPWLSGSDESWWARLAAPMAGGDRGVYFLPEVDDEVLVAFEHGDIRFPYVLGGLWNGKQAPPVKNDDGKNNVRVIHSRSGHVIRLDDSDGSEKIEIIDKTGNNSIVIDSSSNKISIKTDGDILVESQSKVAVKGPSIEIEASGELKLKGSIVNIN
jgi:uncharacterized protein involved in type VI secretion and phage assembly